MAAKAVAVALSAAADGY